MRVMVFFKATGGDEAGVLPTTDGLAAVDAITEEMVKAGVFVAGAGLKSPSSGKRVAFDDLKRMAVVGPIAPASGVVAGFSIWEVKDMDEAVSWALRFPNDASSAGEIEIRPFLEVADLADVLPPEPSDAAPRDPVRLALGVA